MTKSLMLCATLALFASCSTSKTKLSSGGKLVKTLQYKKNDNCNVVNKVVGENDIGSEELAKNHARNLAAKSDGNAIYFDETVANGNKIRVHATAYACGS